MIEFDDKGKFFTDIISKTPIHTIIQTTSHLIHGDIHIINDQRLKDELNLTEKFIAVTDAKILSSDGQILYQVEFMAIQRDKIIWVVPDKEDPSSTTRSQE